MFHQLESSQKKGWLVVLAIPVKQINATVPTKALSVWNFYFDAPNFRSYLTRVATSTSNMFNGLETSSDELFRNFLSSFKNGWPERDNVKFTVVGGNKGLPKSKKKKLSRLTRARNSV